MQKKPSVEKNSTFKYDLKFGQAGESWAAQILSGDEFKIEVKTDRMAHKTGNVFIEITYKGRPSGISTTEADYWLYRIHENDTAIIVPVARLRTIVDEHVKEKGYKFGGEHVKGALIPINKLLA